ncbi:hypothetical protein EJB05_03227, partial [Eragrostis curvula]
MVPPPPQNPRRSAAASFSEEEIAETDPDYLFFLRHAYLEGDSYVLEIPSKEETLAGRSAAADFSEEEIARTDPDYLYFLRHLYPEGNSYVRKIPSSLADPHVDGSTDFPMDEEEGPLADLGLEEKNDVGTAPPAWYDAPDIEPSYRYYLAKTYGTSTEARSAAGNNVQEEEKEAEDQIEELEEDLKEAQMGAGFPADDLVENAAGAIWPEHINERPDSDFKRRLIQVLVKEVDREEYTELFGMATQRTPVEKLRQTRNSITSYKTDKMGSSYLDRYPDLGKQIMNATCRRHGLALMRGLFFWLQNSCHEDQFKPWVDNSILEVIPFDD